MTCRDRQGARVYAACAALEARHPARQFDTLRDIHAYLRKIVWQDWFSSRWPARMVFRVHDGRGIDYAVCRSSDGRTFDMRFPRRYRDEAVVLHELAHACTWGASSDHGVMFCEAYLLLVRRRMGAVAAKILREEFEKRRIAFA